MPECKRTPGVAGSSEGRERLRATRCNVEQRVQLRQLEERAQILVQVREPQLAALLTDLFRQTHQHAEPGRVDVARAGKVDQELPRPTLQLLQYLLLQFLPVAHDQLTLHVDDRDAILLLYIEAHRSSVRGNGREPPVARSVPGTGELCSAVMQATSTISAALAPRDRPLHGRASPCRTGPIASAWPSRCTSL